MKQSEIMSSFEADAWFRRNRDRLGAHDPVSEMIKESGFRPQSVLEIGCANGWRLVKLRNDYDCDVSGIEPSMDAAMDAANLKVPIYVTTADSLPFGPASFDLVIYGFCLYLADPADWMRIAAEGDRVLRDDGHIVIHDFVEPGRPFARRYEHRDGVLAYHVDFSALWLANPLYSLVRRSFYRNDEMATVLKKSSASTIEVVE